MHTAARVLDRALWVVVFAALGYAAGWALRIASVFVLVLVGFSFYALHAGVFLALAVWLASAFLLYRHIRRRHPHSTQHLLPSLVGMLTAIVPFLAVDV